MGNQQLRHEVYVSYDDTDGRAYIGKHSGSPRNPKYFGSYTDRSFKPTHKEILFESNSEKECLELESMLQWFLGTTTNPHFANRGRFSNNKGLVFTDNPMNYPEHRAKIAQAPGHKRRTARRRSGKHTEKEWDHLQRLNAHQSIPTNHPYRDKTKYLFVNYKLEREFIGTRTEFQMFSLIHQQTVERMVKRKYSVQIGTRGKLDWFCKGCMLEFTD